MAYLAAGRGEEIKLKNVWKWEVPRSD